MIVKGRNVSPATAALAFRIYGHCHPGWGHTYAEVAEALGVSAPRVQRTAIAVGWNGRFTSVSDGGAAYGSVLVNGPNSMTSTSADFEPFRRMAAAMGEDE